MKGLFRWIRSIVSNDSLNQKTHKVSSRQSIYQEEAKLLAESGKGTICIKLEKTKAFNLDLIASNALLRLFVNQDLIKLYCIYRGRFILLKQAHCKDIGLNNNLECTYWVSFQSTTRTVLFGKHKPNIQHSCFSFTLPKSNKSVQQFWMNKISHYRIDTPAVIYLSQEVVSSRTPRKARINLLNARS